MLQVIQTAASDCLRYREVLYRLLSRDIKVKYKHTWLGYLWSLLNPIFQIGVMTVVFSHVVKQDMRDYTLFLVSGFIGWVFFQTAVMMAGVSFLENAAFLRKIYLPKVLFPVEKVAFRMVDFLFSLVAVTLVAAIAGYPIHSTFLYVPAASVILFVFTLGASLLMAVAVVFFRDLLHIQSVLLQLVYFATPIIYPLSALPPSYQRVMAWNPVYVQIRLFQRLIYDGILPSLAEWASAGALAVVFLGLGLAALRLADDEILFRL